MNVYVQSDAAERGDLDGILRSTVRSNANVLVPLADLVTITRSQEPAIVERENRQRVVNVTANTAARSNRSGHRTDGRTIAGSRLSAAGARVEPRGDIEQLIETVGKYLATLALSVVIVYGYSRYLV